MARAAEGVPIRGAGVYDQAMRYWPIVTFLCSALAYGGETLPDEARFGAADEVDMQERFNAQVMDAEELENLYLQSPVEISSSPASAMRSVQGEELQSITEAQNLERQRAESLSSQPPPAPVDIPNLPTLPAGVPIRQL